MILDEGAWAMQTAVESTGVRTEHPCVRARFVAAAAAEHADEVDRDARFPSETFAAARQHRLLSMLVPDGAGR